MHRYAENGSFNGQNQALDHVYWLAGSPCAGKSSISELLAREYGLCLVSVDNAFMKNHRKRIDPHQHPTLHKWATTPWSDLWMQSADVLLAEAKSAYSEHFQMIASDLCDLPVGSPVLVEGTALLPDAVHRLGVAPCNAIWLVPTEEFQHTKYPCRGDWVQHILGQCENPEQAFQNWMDRDVAFARWVPERTQALGLRAMQIDGTHTVDEYTTLVAQHFRLRTVIR
jgi:hypothetical protein